MSRAAGLLWEEPALEICLCGAVTGQKDRYRKELMPGRSCCEPGQLLFLPDHGIILSLLGCKGSPCKGPWDAHGILGYTRIGYTRIRYANGRILLMLPTPAETTVTVEAGVCCSTQQLCAWFSCLGNSEDALWLSCLLQNPLCVLKSFKGSWAGWKD